jgi:hypothetical protein
MLGSHHQTKRVCMSARLYVFFFYIDIIIAYSYTWKNTAATVPTAMHANTRHVPVAWKQKMDWENPSCPD